MRNEDKLATVPGERRTGGCRWWGLDPGDRKIPKGVQGESTRSLWRLPVWGVKARITPGIRQGGLERRRPWWRTQEEEWVQDWSQHVTEHLEVPPSLFTGPGQGSSSEQ